MYWNFTGCITFASSHIDFYYNTDAGTWVWADGSKVDYIAWAAGRPCNYCLYARLYADECIESMDVYLKWGAEPYSNITERSFICQKNSNH